MAIWAGRNLLRQSQFVSENRCDRAGAKVAERFRGVKGARQPTMENRFFEHPILNSPYEYPARHWELDASGQPTQRIGETRRTAQFITPIPKPRKRKESPTQEDLEFDDGAGLSTRKQRYEPIPIINELRQQVDEWRRLPSPNDWLVTPETARLLQHWRHHQFQGIRPFFCQIEAAETAIWLTEVAPKRAGGEEVSGASGQCQCRGES